MKKLLIKVFCGTLFLLCIFTGCNNSTSDETSKKIEISTVKPEENAAAKLSTIDKELLVSMPPIFESKPIVEESSKEVKENKSSTIEDGNETEEESLVEEYDVTEESYETEDTSIEEEVYYEESYCESIEESYCESIEESYCESIEESEEEYIEYYEDESSYENIVNNDEEYNYNNSTEALYTPADFQNMGIINWGSWSWTFYSQRVLPGDGLIIPGRYVDYNGYVCDENDYICLASSSLDKGTVVDTPFGKMGKVYDCGCPTYILDVYVDW